MNIFYYNLYPTINKKENQAKSRKYFNPQEGSCIFTGTLHLKLIKINPFYHGLHVSDNSLYKDHI